MEDIEFHSPPNEWKENPDLKYQFFRYVLVFDHFKSELYILHNESNKSADFEDNIANI